MFPVAMAWSWVAMAITVVDRAAKRRIRSWARVTLPMTSGKGPVVANRSGQEPLYIPLADERDHGLPGIPVKNRGRPQDLQDEKFC